MARGATPSREAAEAYRVARLPHRIDAPNSVLGFRRARLGETLDAATGKPTELYPLCSRTMLEELDSFGVGISLYFRQLLALFGVAVVCAFILLTSALHNAKVCDHPSEIRGGSVEQGGQDLDFRQAGLSSGSAAGCLKTNLSASKNVAPDIAVCIVMLLAALGADTMRSKYKNRVDENAQTAADYTVVVRNLPGHVVDPDLYKAFFDEHVRDDVVCVTLGKDNGLLMTLLAQRFGFTRDLEEFSKNDIPELGTLGRLVQPFVYGLGLLKTPKYASENLEKVEIQLKEYIQKNSGDDWHKPTRVYVTFGTETGREHALETFETSGVRRYLDRCGLESENTPIAFEGSVLDVSRPVEPSEILWHTSHVRRSERWARLLVSLGLTAALVTGFVFVSMGIDDPVALSLWVTFVNSTLPIVLKAMQVGVEVHREYGDEQDSLFMKLLLSRWANTVIAVFFAYGRRTRLSATALSGVMTILLMDAFLLPLLRVFDVYDLFMRFVVGPKQPSQPSMNALWSGADWNIAERYTDVMKTLLVGLFYAAAVPYGLFVTAAALLTSFFVDHYCLLRLWARKPDFDDQISRRAIGCVSFVVFLHVLATQYFFQNWGVYPRDAIQAECFGVGTDSRDALRNGTCTAMMSTAGHCFVGTFMRCSPSTNDDKPWDRTGAQKLARRAYPAIGAIALAVALWRLFGIVAKRCLKEFVWGQHRHDYDKRMPVGFRDLGWNIDAYVPTAPHPVLGEPPLVAAVVRGLPDDFMPLPPGVSPRTHTVCSRDAIRTLVPPADGYAASEAQLDAVLGDIFGEVKYYPKEGAEPAAQMSVHLSRARGSRRPTYTSEEGGSMGAGPPPTSGGSMGAAPPPVPKQPVSYARPAAVPRPAMPQPAVPRPAQVELPRVPGGAPAALPPGWERQRTPDGREYFIDHSTQTTSWTRPTF